MNYYCNKCKEYFNHPYYCIHKYNPDAPSLKGNSMNNIVDLNGGDLGRAYDRCTRIENIPLLVKTIAELYSNLRSLVERPKALSYCFEVSTKDIKVLNYLVTGNLDNQLSEGVRFYECDGHRVFDIRGASGGIVTSCCFYLIAEGTK